MSNNHNLFSGGLAELVSSPTLLTYSFFTYWMTGKRSVGHAMQLLRLPYNPSSLPLLVYKNKQIYVDLQSEQKTLYDKTCFHYVQRNNTDEIPRLRISPVKLLDPRAITHTLQLLIRQSVWIAKQEQTVQFAKRLVAQIPGEASEKTIADCEQVLIKHVWPQIIAIGMLCEFFHVYLEKEAKGKSMDVLEKVSKHVARSDWFFLSLSEQSHVKTGSLSFTKYMKRYGLRSDLDYELTSPRWYEIPDEIKKGYSKQYY